jgi:hypothetical protein
MKKDVGKKKGTIKTEESTNHIRPAKPFTKPLPYNYAIFKTGVFTVNMV